MPTEIDELMDRDPLSLSDQDIDAIIAYQRKHRATVEAGGKAKKAFGPGLSLDSVISKIVPKSTEPTIRRRA